MTNADIKALVAKIRNDTLDRAERFVAANAIESLAASDANIKALVDELRTMLKEAEARAEAAEAKLAQVRCALGDLIDLVRLTRLSTHVVMHNARIALEATP